VRFPVPNTCVMRVVPWFLGEKIVSDVLKDLVMAWPGCVVVCSLLSQ